MTPTPRSPPRSPTHFPSSKRCGGHLAANERRIATALALGLSPHGKQAKARTGIASASAAQRALQVLTRAGVLDSGTGALTDPLLAVWLRLEHAPAGPLR